MKGIKYCCLIVGLLDGIVKFSNLNFFVRFINKDERNSNNS